MAEQLPPVPNKVDYSQVLFQNIERELNKIRLNVQDIESKQKQSQEKLSQLNTTVNGQQGSIIQPSKLKTVLNQNEKKRYAEIGKRFVQGAQSQFNRIRKKIKFKEGMRSKKDTFLNGIDKVKQEKIQKQKVNFWAKLLGGLALIGLAAYIFRDKIQKMLPDLSKQSGGLIERIFKWVGNLIKGCYDFITETISNGITSTFHKLMTESIPNILQIFFLQTLPQAIFNTHLAVLSAFSDKAGDRLDQEMVDPSIATDINNTVDAGAEEAARMIENGDVKKDESGKYVNAAQLYKDDKSKQMAEIQKKLDSGQTLSANEAETWRRNVAQFKLKNAGGKYEKMIQLLGQLVTVTSMTTKQVKDVSGEANKLSKQDLQKNLMTKIAKGQFDTRAYIQYYKANVGNLQVGANEQQKRKAKIQFYARSIAHAQGIRQEKQITKIIQNLTEFYSGKELNELDDFSNFIRELYKEQQRLNSNTENYQKQQAERAKKLKPPLVSLQLHTITDLITEPIAQFLSTVDSFLKGGIDVSKVSQVIKVGFEQLANYFNGFFKSTVAFLVNFLHNIEGITIVVPNANNAIPKDGEKDGEKKNQSAPQTVIGQTQAKEGSVALIADFGSLTLNPLTEFITATANAQTEVLKAAQETSNEISKLTEAVVFLKDLNVAERQFVAAMGAQLGEVDKGLLEHLQTSKLAIASNKSDITKLGKLIQDMKNVPFKKDTYLLAQVDDL